MFKNFFIAPVRPSLSRFQRLQLAASGLGAELVKGAVYEARYELWRDCKVVSHCTSLDEVEIVIENHGGKI